MGREPPFRGPESDAVRRAQRAGGASESYRAEERQAEAPSSLPESPECPFCRGSETELMNAFGSHASVSTYWCLACRSPFELMRWR